MTLERFGAGVDAVVDIADDGTLSLRWPDGRRRPEIAVRTELLETMLDELNTGRRALEVLGNVASALAGLVPSAERRADAPVDTP